MAEVPAALAAEIQVLEQKHAENPEGRYFVPLANAYRKAGDVARAEHLLQSGLRKHPDYLSARIVLGRCYADRGETQTAGSEFLQVLAIDPQNLIALRTLGELATADGRRGEAEHWYRELLTVDPMNDEARTVLHHLRQAQAEEEEAFDPGPGWWERDEEEALATEGPAEEPSGSRHPADPTTPPTGWAADADEVGETQEWVERPGPARAPPVLTGSGEERDPREADAGQDFFAEVAPDAEGEPEASPENDVLTPTMADLYAAQGFPDRAAEVYRKLIDSRGDDPELRERLSRVESLGAPAAVADAPETSVRLPAAPAEHPADSFADSFVNGFGNAPLEAGPPESIAATTVAASRGGISIGAYMQALVSWEPQRPFATGSSAGSDAPADSGGAAAGYELAPDSFTVVEPAEASREVAVPRSGPAMETPSLGPFDAEDDDLESFQAWLRSLKR